MADYNRTQTNQQTQTDQQSQFAQRSINSNYGEHEQSTDKEKQKRIIAWLTDAYAMESEGAKTLTQHAQAAERYPEVQTKLRQHAEETRRHAKQVKGCLQRLGSQPSSAKEAVGNVVGSVRGVVTQAAKDVVVKNILADYASEHFEIACYKSLVAAAEEVSDQETAQVCRDVLREEEAMVAFLSKQIAPVTQQFMAKQARGRNDKKASSPTQKTPDEQDGGLLKSAKQNIPALASVLVAVVGAGLLLAQVLTRVLRGNKEQPKRQASEYQTTYEHDDQPYSGAIASHDQSYDQPPQPTYSQGEVREVDSTEVDSLEVGSLTAEVTKEDYRTESPTADDISARLEQNSQLDASDIEVVVGKSGRVTLKGTVDSEEAKRLAKETTKDVPNINEVHNHLKVKA